MSVSIESKNDKTHEGIFLLRKGFPLIKSECNLGNECNLKISSASSIRLCERLISYTFLNCSALVIVEMTL